MKNFPLQPTDDPRLRILVDKAMSKLRYRLLDLVLLTTFVSFACAAYVSGYYLSIDGFYAVFPRYLTGDLEA